MKKTNDSDSFRRNKRNQMSRSSTCFVSCRNGSVIANASVSLTSDDVTDAIDLARVGAHTLRESVNSGEFLPMLGPVAIEFYGGKNYLKQTMYRQAFFLVNDDR